MRFLQAFVLLSLWLVSLPAHALDAINVPLDAEALDLTRAVDRFVEVGDRIQVSTAAGLDGIVRRIEVRAREADSAGNWVVFALTNTSNEQIDRLLVAPHFRLANSQIIWPDLGALRVVAISPSQGLAPQRLESQEADVFRITLDPGAVVTYVVELRTQSLPQLILWQEDEYRDSVNSTTLYKGIVLGIAGLLALFLTILFIVKRSAMFPAVSGVAWAVLAYLAIEFGFWNQIFNLEPGDEQVTRAIAEVVLAASLVLLLYAYLSLSEVHSAFFRIGLVWAAFFSVLIGLAVFEPQIASGIARMGLGVIGITGLMVIVPMSLQGFDRAVHLIPSWLVFITWLFTAWLAVSGNLVNDLVSPALAGGLVLLVLLLGFTVMQHAFAGGTLAEGLVSDSERKMLALSGSGDLVWDWDLAKDRVYSSPATEDILGLKRGSLAGPFHDWISNIHPGERDHFRHVIEAVVAAGRGRIDQTVRMRTEDGHFKWFRLRARPVVAGEGVFRLIGTMLDVTDMKTTQERLLRDAIHDSLTGLPNRALFLDRVQAAMDRAANEGVTRPTVIFINIDHFSQHNTNVGTSAADSLLTMVARRIDRLLKQNDTLARLNGDQFAILLLSEQKPASVARLTEKIRRGLKAPVVFGEDEVNLTVSIGLATYDPNAESAENVLRDAEIAMSHAKRLGGDRCEAYRPSLSDHGSSNVAVEADLRQALDNDQLSVFYQPIIRLSDGALAGFEALLRWDHPRHGRMAPAEFVPIAERSGLIIPVGLFVMERAARDLKRWMSDDPEAARLFTSVNISSRQLLRHDLLNDLRAILARADLPGSSLKLELTESLVMENPEYAAQVLARCRELGIGLSLDDFGTGYSSLAYLQRFPFDTIKIDQSFVADLKHGEPAVVLGAIVALGHDLDMDIVAEGIENQDAANILNALGCEYGQGFHYGHAMPAKAVPVFMKSFEPVAVSSSATPAIGPDAASSTATPAATGTVTNGAAAVGALGSQDMTPTMDSLPLPLTDFNEPDPASTAKMPIAQRLRDTLKRAKKPAASDAGVDVDTGTPAPAVSGGTAPQAADSTPNGGDKTPDDAVVIEHTTQPSTPASGAPGKPAPATNGLPPPPPQPVLSPKTKDTVPTLDEIRRRSALSLSERSAELDRYREQREARMKARAEARAAAQANGDTMPSLAAFEALLPAGATTKKDDASKDESTKGDDTQSDAPQASRDEQPEPDAAAK